MKQREWLESRNPVSRRARWVGINEAYEHYMDWLVRKTHDNPRKAINLDAALKKYPRPKEWDRELADVLGSDNVRRTPRGLAIEYNINARPDALEPYGQENLARRALTRDRLYMRKLERELMDWQLMIGRFEESLVERIREEWPHKVQPRVAPKGRGPIKRVLNMLWSDAHYGISISNREIPSNHYSWTEATRRTLEYIEQVCAYKTDHRDETELQVLIGDDMFAGIIHLDDHGIDLLTNQFSGSLNIMAGALEEARKHFRRTTVRFAGGGNHGRMDPKQRALAQKWNGFDRMLAIAIAARFRGCEDITFNMPWTPYNLFDTLGHRFCLTHGDTVMGGFKSSGRNNFNLKSVQMELLKLQISQMDLETFSRANRIRVLAMGHYHQAMCLPISHDCELFVNGSLCGTDAYAQGAIGEHGSDASQWIWETTEAHPVGDMRKIKLSRTAPPQLPREVVVTDPQQTTQPKSIRQLAAELGLPKSTVHARLKAGTLTR